MPLTFQKRSSDDAVTRSAPVGIADAQSGSSVSALVSLSSSRVQELEDAAERLGILVDTFLLAGFAALLSRLTHQDVIDVQVGQKSLVHFDLEGDCSFRRASKQGSALVSTSAAEAEQRAARQGVHYEFRRGNNSEGRSRSSSLRLSLTQADSQRDEPGSKVAGNTSGSELRLESPSGSWTEAVLESWLEHLVVLLDAAQKNPDMPVSQLPLWTEDSAKAFYARLNATSREFPGPQSVPALVASQTARHGETIAIVAGGRRYTYAELDARSTMLAKQLRAAGAGANRAVAVCMERSVDLPVSLLAVLKSGAFYVPLDPHNPSLRLRGILEECQPVALISDSGTAGSLKEALGSSAIPMLQAEDSANEAGLDDSPESSVPAIEHSNLAYTIYTSGTTGKPKGVRITHGALLNLICSMGRSPGAGDADRTLAVAPISFDIATMDMFLPLCTGGTLVLASRSDAVDPYRLSQLIEEHDVTCMQATPATWRMMMTSGWRGKRNLKMISGGEALPRELANDLLRVGGELWNCYGPTETTIYSAVIQLHPELGIVPVGPPMANTTFYVMDKAGFPVPPGVPGELYIGGAGVSPGYVNRPELTAQRFVADRFGSGSGNTVFCTGDLVRLVNDDEFEFYGRLDTQVKLRGFRIELGEIESVLRSHTSLSDAVVILREDVPGEPRLVAYVIAAGQPVTAAALQEFAAQSVPEYMLPSVIVTVDKYPMSASGKIDRRALPVPETIAGQIVPNRPKAAIASGEIETRLLRIFREVLRNDTIGVTDSFFQFGGYSLLTVRLFSRIERELHARLPISLLFDTPTVRELARVIEKGTAPSIIVPIRPQGTSAPLFIVQSYLLYSAMLEMVEPDRPIYGVREMGDEKQAMSVEERARQFSREILNVYSDGPISLVGWCAAGTLTVEIARQLRAAGHVVGLVVLFDAERPGFAPPRGIKAWFSRLWKKATFHARRLHNIPWGRRFTYIWEAMGRNWDWAVESYYTAHFHTMLWLQKRFGVSLSEAAFNNVYASLSALKDYSVRPYPGKLNLFRAADVPNFAGMDSTLGWGTIAEGGVDVNFVPGDHVSMFKKPHIESLAVRLQQELRNSEKSARDVSPVSPAPR